MPDPSIIAITLEFFGTILIGVAVLRVHMRVSKEHRIDDIVLRSIRRERKLTIVGMILITIGFLLNFV